MNKPRTVQVNTRLSLAEYKLIQAKAKAAGVRLSTYLRLAALEREQKGVR